MSEGHSFSFKYFDKPSLCFVPLIETSILGIKNPAILRRGILVVRKVAAVP